MNPLAWLNPGRWLLVAGAIAALVLGWGALRHHLVEEGRAEVRAQWDEDRAHAQAAAAAAALASAKETQRRMDRQQENQHAQDALLARMRRDRDAAVAATDRLQQRAAAYLDAAGCGGLAGDPAAECVRAAAAAIGDALGRSAAIARRAAADADEARARGLKCEADYDALTATP